jgi:hypothetical protein
MFLGGPRRLTALGDGGWGLFGGLGLVAVSPSSGNVTGLTSAYLGLEYSYHGFGALLVGGIRRETVLASGYEVNTHVAAGTPVPTTMTVAPAAGIVLNVTSDVLKIPGTFVP